MPLDGPAGPVDLGLPTGLLDLCHRHLPTIFRKFKNGEDHWGCARDGFLANATCWGAVIGTFDALESQFLDFLRRLYGHGLVWAVGPIKPAGPPAARGRRSLVSVEELTAWLDARPVRSVVYICFGSQFALREKQVAVIAAALEASGVGLVWVAGGGAAVPEQFERRTVEQGMVIRGWAPQALILRHRAVAAFVTHCGWNSVVEGLAAGVTLLTWAMQADQYVNAALVVDVAGAAVRVGEGWEEGVPAAEELRGVLVRAVAEDGGWPEVRARAEELRREALAEGRSSAKGMEELVKELAGLGSAVDEE